MFKTAFPPEGIPAGPEESLRRSCWGPALLQGAALYGKCKDVRSGCLSCSTQSVQPFLAQLPRHRNLVVVCWKHTIFLAFSFLQVHQQSLQKEERNKRRGKRSGARCGWFPQHLKSLISAPRSERAWACCARRGREERQKKNNIK